MSALRLDGLRTLVLRAEPEASETADRLKALGAVPILAPLTRIRFDGVDARDLAGVQAVLVTSRNGARALLSAGLPKALSVLAVGDATAAVLREGGVAAVSAAGDSEALLGLVTRRLRPDAGQVLHLHGQDVAGDLAGALRQAGFDARALVGYRAEAIAAPAAAAALAQGHVDAALFYSQRSGGLFAKLVEDGGLARACGRVVAAAISARVAAPLAGIGFRRLGLAARPDEASLLVALGEAHLSGGAGGR